MLTKVLAAHSYDSFKKTTNVIVENSKGDWQVLGKERSQGLEKEPEAADLARISSIAREELKKFADSTPCQTPEEYKNLMSNLTAIDSDIDKHNQKISQTRVYKIFEFLGLEGFLKIATIKDNVSSHLFSKNVELTQPGIKGLIGAKVEVISNGTSTDQDLDDLKDDLEACERFIAQIGNPSLDNPPTLDLGEGIQVSIKQNKRDDQWSFRSADDQPRRVMPLQFECSNPQEVVEIENSPKESSCVIKRGHLEIKLTYYPNFSNA